jgi:phi13 family phage major tail protein
MVNYNGTIVGLEDIYYAKLTSDASDGAVYGTPVKITGAIMANVKSGSNSATLFGDNAPLDTSTSLGNIELELNVADIPLETKAILLGSTAVTAGKLSSKSSDTPPWIALGFKGKKSNGKYRYVWLDKGKFRDPDDNYETKKDSVNYQPPTINGNFVAREYDKEWKQTLDEDATGYQASMGTNWFIDGPDAP